MVRKDAAADDLSAFFDDLAHDLRSPLAVIQGYSGLLALERAGPLTARQREFLAGIQVQQELLHARLEAFLVTAAYLGGYRSQRPRPLDLAGELSRYLADEDRAGRAGLEQAAGGLPADVAVSADPDLLGHVLDLLGPLIAATVGPQARLGLDVQAGADRCWICFVGDGRADPGRPEERDLTVAHRLLDLLGASLVWSAPPDLADGGAGIVCACGLPWTAARRSHRTSG